MLISSCSVQPAAPCFRHLHRSLFIPVPQDMFRLPIIGPIIMMFAPDDPSAKNFGKAMLVLQIFFGIIGAIFSSTVIALLRYSLGI